MFQTTSVLCHFFMTSGNLKIFGGMFVETRSEEKSQKIEFEIVFDAQKPTVL